MSLLSLRGYWQSAIRLLCGQRGDLSTYIAQGIMALAAISLTGVILFAFTAVGAHIRDIVTAWLNVPITTGQ
ncbi:MAG: hypothetical protein ACYCOS_08195 [Sulfobacillus sp.]